MRRLGRLALRGAQTLWSALRAACGDDAYERYCAHQAARRAVGPPLTRRAFYEDTQRRKWSGVSRCC
jgi:uncharacterized short protein YbdD (DUF466 family)